MEETGSLDQVQHWCTKRRFQHTASMDAPRSATPFTLLCYTVNQQLCYLASTEIKCLAVMFRRKKKFYLLNAPLKIHQAVFFLFFLLLSSKKYSVYYSTKKYVMLNTAPLCHWTLCEISTCERAKQWAQLQASNAGDIVMFDCVIRRHRFWLSDFTTTSHNAENL